jgi:uncharacterized membrane protein (UPF0127 family)
MRASVIAFALVVGCHGGSAADDKPAVAAPGDAAAAPGEAVVFHTGSGDVVVAVEIADTPAERARGLMERKEMPQDHGMIFAFPREDIQRFWMKNTLIALDMIFVNTQHEVVGVVPDAEPMTLEERSVGLPSAYVVEVNGGFAKKNGIAAGTRVDFRNIPTTPPKT